jgi:PhnB protein
MTTKDEAAIRTVLDERTEALRTKDAALAVARYAADVVSFDLAPPLRFTGTEVTGTTGVQAWFDTWSGPIGWEIRDLNVATGGDIAYAFALNRMTGTKRDGETTDLWVRSTTCLRRMGGKWAIVHEHVSVPFYMDGSYKAAIDLKP